MSSLTVENASLDYLIIGDNISLKKIFFEKMLHYATKRENKPMMKKYRAIKNLNLKIEENDRVGLIGRNGAGKSTLLKMLTGIYEPTFGKIIVDGTISSLLETTTGLNSEISGYENIFLLGTLLGKSKEEMRALIPEIKEFTELGDFLYNPVRTYSVGMRVRLSFAIVTSIEPNILLLDEVVGVGDRIFKSKANKRIESLVERSKILVLSTHHDEMIQEFCNKVLLLHQGEKIFYGDVHEGLKLYHEKYTPEPKKTQVAVPQQPRRKKAKARAPEPAL